MLPELESIRRQSIATPELRSRQHRDPANSTSSSRTRCSSSSRLAITRLCALACAPSWLPRSRVAKYASDSVSDIFATSPSMRTCRPQWLAVPEDRGEWILFEFATFARFVVRVPTDGGVIDVTKQHHPRAGLAVARRGRHRDGVAIEHLALGLVEPTSELDEGIRDRSRPVPAGSTARSRDVRELPVRCRRKIERTRPVVTKPVRAGGRDHRGVVGAHRHRR